MASSGSGKRNAAFAPQRDCWLACPFAVGSRRFIAVTEVFRPRRLAAVSPPVWPPPLWPPPLAWGGVAAVAAGSRRLRLTAAKTSVLEGW